MAKDDRLIESMFDEMIETTVKPDGEVDAKLVSPSAEEVENAVADLIRSFREFTEIMSRGVNPTDPVKSVGWWHAVECLMLADSRLKQLFCGRDLSPASVRQYAEFRSKTLEGKPFKANA